MPGIFAEQIIVRFIFILASVLRATAHNYTTVLVTVGIAFAWNWVSVISAGSSTGRSVNNEIYN